MLHHDWATAFLNMSDTQVEVKLLKKKPSAILGKPQKVKGMTSKKVGLQISEYHGLKSKI
jgi:hypothetical protein